MDNKPKNDNDRASSMMMNMKEDIKGDEGMVMFYAGKTSGNVLQRFQAICAIILVLHHFCDKCQPASQPGALGTT